MPGRRENRFTVKVTGSMTVTVKQVLFLLMLIGMGVAALYQR
ncbi:hypothetical protein [Amycolatopsis sp. NPDC003676]